MSTQTKASTLKQLHEAPEILRLVNIWDAISAKTVADLAETRALATAGHSIAASHGYEDGTIPLEVNLQAISEIVAATSLPVTADLDDGYDSPGESVRRAIGVGAVGANVEDRLRPLDESVQRVSEVVSAAVAEGIDFQLNARTDAFVKGGDRSPEEKLADAIERGRAYLDAGASLVFVPGATTADVVERLVAAFGDRKLSIIGLPGALPASEYEKLGVARITYGPLTQRVALRALRDLASDLYGSGVIPKDTPALN